MAKDSERSGQDGARLLAVDSAILEGVSVELNASLGAVSLTIGELSSLRSGSTVKLGTKMNEPIELRLNGTVVARGEIVAVDENFGIRILDIAKTA